MAIMTAVAMAVATAVGTAVAKAIGTAVVMAIGTAIATALFLHGLHMGPSRSVLLIEAPRGAHRTGSVVRAWLAIGTAVETAVGTAKGLRTTVETAV